MEGAINELATVPVGSHWLAAVSKSQLLGIKLSGNHPAHSKVGNPRWQYNCNVATPKTMGSLASALVCASDHFGPNYATLELLGCLCFGSKAVRALARNTNPTPRLS